MAQTFIWGYGYETGQRNARGEAIVDINLLVSGIIGLSPALALLWFTLREYDYPYVEKTLFDSRKVFLLLAVGIVFGMIAGAFYYSIRFYPELILFLLIAIGFAVFEEIFKFVVLNLKTFQLKFDTAFHGFSLGVGLSSTFVLYHVYFSILQYTSVPITVWITLILFSVTMCFVHGSTGCIIGFGAAEGRPWFYFVEAMMVRVFLIIILIPVIADMGDEWVRVVSLAVALVASVYVYRYVYKEIIPGAIPENIRRKKRMESRRIMKRKT